MVVWVLKKLLSVFVLYTLMVDRVFKSNYLSLFFAHNCHG